jgi:hypothetical protein
MSAFDALRAPVGAGPNAKPVISEADASARLVGSRAAFGGAGWDAVRAGGTKAATATRMAAPAGPAGAVVAAAGRSANRLRRWAKQGQQQ